MTSKSFQVMAAHRCSAGQVIEGYVHKFRLDAHDGAAVRVVAPVPETAAKHAAWLLRLAGV